MRNLVIAILCLSLTALAAAQAPSAAPSASEPKEPTAIIETTDGNISCTLFPDQAPLTVANFIGLASGTQPWESPKTGQIKHTPLYDGTICHRVIPNFMIQCGDPAGNGSGGPGYDFKDEFSSSLTFNQPGRLAMANSGPNTNGSQFFITEVPTPHLNGKHTIFGQCENLDVVKNIARLATDPRTDRPYAPPKIIHIKIMNAPKLAAAPFVPKQKEGNLGSDSVAQEINKIRNSPHGTMPAAQATRSKLGGNSAIAVENRTEYALYFYVSGPSGKTLEIPPGQSQSITISPGEYEIAARVSSPSVMPFYGKDTYAANTQYSEQFYLTPKPH